LVASPYNGTSEVLWGFTGANWVNRTQQYFCPDPGCFGPDPNPRISIGDTRVDEGDDGTAQLIFPLTLSCPSDQPVSVRVTTVDGTAIAGEDYVALDQVITFQPGERAKSVIVDVIADATIEGDEELYVDLSEGTGGTLRYDRGTGVIVTDDVALSVQYLDVVEGGGETTRFATKIFLSNVQSVATNISYTVSAGTATEGVDFVAKNATVTVPAGSTTATISFDVIGDSIAESDETVVLTLEPQGASYVSDLVTDIVIRDDDACPGLNLIDNPSNELALVDGTPPGWQRISGSAWSRRGSNPSAYDGDVYFATGDDNAMGEIAQDVDVSGFAQRIDVGVQRFVFSGRLRSYPQSPTDTPRMIVEYRDSAGTVLDSYDTLEVSHTSNWIRYADLRTAPVGTRTIRVRLLGTRNNGDFNDSYFDDLSLVSLDVPPFSIDGDISVVEGESGTTDAVFTVSLACPSPVTTRVDYLTNDGSANAGSDYQATFGTLTFAPGEISQPVAVAVLGDTAAEADETFTLRLANAVNAVIDRDQATATILADEVIATVAGASVVEGGAGTTGTVDVAVSLSAASVVPVSLDFATADHGGADAALAGIDYQSQSGSLVFAPGETTKTITLTVLGDAEVENDESFDVRLSNAVNAGLGPAATVIVLDDDAVLTVGDARQNEGDAGVSTMLFTATLSKPVALPVSVDYQTVDDSAVAGSDYTATSGTLSFAAGQTSATFTVDVLGDTVLESGELFTVELSNPVDVTVIDTSATGFIVDDDDCRGPQLLGNGDAEQAPRGGAIPDWQILEGDWTTTGGDPLEGDAFFRPTDVALARLAQTVDVTPFATRIDLGAQPFLFEAWVRSAEDEPARVVVEYRAADDSVLDRYDSGDVISLGTWLQLADQRTAPPGTRTIHVELIAQRLVGSGLEVDFDALELRPLSAPTMFAGEGQLVEGDGATLTLDVPVRLTCAADTVVTVDYVTEEVDALDGVDFLGTSGTLTFAIGEVEQMVSITVLDDPQLELRETVRVRLSNVTGDAALWGDVGFGRILDDDIGGETTVRELRTFWLGDLRIFAWDDATQVTLIDIRDNQPLPLTDNRLGALNVDSNPFVLDGGESFEGFGDDIQIRIVAEDADGNGQLKPITVWTGRLAGASKHPSTSPSADPWMSYIPAFSIDPRRNGRELGRSFLGFTSSELYLFVEKGVDETRIVIEDLITNTDFDDDDSQILGPADADYADGDVEIYYLTGFEDDTVRISGNVEMSVLAGMSSRGTPDWTATPPSYGFGDDASELGTKFYAFVNRSVTVFPTEDDTTVTITDLSDGDDTITFTLQNGELGGISYDLYTPTLNARVGNQIDPRNNNPTVNITTAPTAFDDDYVRIESDKPILVYVGPAASDTFEFADVAFSVPTGPESRVIYAYAQNGGEEDLQIFAFTDDTQVTITSLTRTLGFGTQSHHNFVIGPGFGSNGWRRGVAGGDVWWASDVWDGELLRIESTKPIVVLNGDYDTTHFGAFLPFVIDTEDLPPRADAGPDQTVSAGAVVSFDGSGSFDQDNLVGPEIPTYVWDLDLDVDSDGDGDPRNDADLTGATPTRRYLVPGVFRVGLVYTDDEGEADGDEMVLTVEPHPLTVTKVDAFADVAARPGGVVTYTFTVSNTSASDLTDVSLVDALPVETAVVASSASTSLGTVSSESPLTVDVPSLLVGASFTVTVQVVVDPALPIEIDTLVNQAEVGASGFPTFPSDDPAAPGIADPTTTPVVALPELALTKTVAHLDDVDGDGLVEPGDALRYTLVLDHLGGGWATSVQLSDAIPADTMVVAGSVVTSLGTVLGEDPVSIDLGALSSGTVTVTFDVRIDAALPAGVDTIVNQATVTSQELPPLLSDDPTLPGDADPTVIGVVAAPELAVSKRDVHELDLDGDGRVDAGDRIRYDLVVTNSGNIGASNVLLTDIVPTDTTLVLGSETTTHGFVAVAVDNRSLEVQIGDAEVGDPVTVSFVVELDDPLPLRLEEIVNQATVSSTELADVLSDDPDTVAALDPTVTPIAETGDTAFCTDDSFDTVPADWTLGYFGDADQGSVEVVNGALRLAGNGSSLYHGDDDGAFFHRTVEGD
ncbi:MAG: Calx-beta domain-containing protein, partial [Acidobacteriota bacterium]